MWRGLESGDLVLTGKWKGIAGEFRLTLAEVAYCRLHFVDQNMAHQFENTDLWNREKTIELNL